jgi:hypothetical protein
MFNFLKRLFVGEETAPAWYVETMNTVANMLERPLVWGNPTVCLIPMEVSGKVYYAGATLGQMSVLVAVVSKVDVNTPGLRQDLSQRNRESLYGTWVIQEGPILKVEIVFQDFTPERVSRAIQVLLPAVIEFDREWLGPKGKPNVRVKAISS